jgi:hypothetical protein
MHKHNNKIWKKKWNELLLGYWMYEENGEEWEEKDKEMKIKKKN